MAMREIYTMMEIERKNAEMIFGVLDKEKTELEVKMEELKETLADITARWNKAKNNRECIELSMETLSTLGDFSPTEEEKEKEKEFVKEEAKEEAPVLNIEGRKVKQPKFTRKTALLTKYAPDGTKLGSYTTQQKFANELKVSLASARNYIFKRSKEEQIAKWGFYMAYEH